MKQKQFTSIVIFIMLVLLQTQNHAQHQDSISKSVKDYWQLMDKLTLRYKGKKEISKNYTNDEIDTLTKKYYKAMIEDPIGLKTKVDEDFQKWSSDARSIRGLPQDLKPAIKLRIMREIIAKKYGANFAEIISVPYYLKIKIVGDSGSIYQSPENSGDIRVGQANYFGVVEDVIKGEKVFKINQKIIISFLSFWIADSRKTFIIGKTYFIPLKPWDSYHNYSKLTINIFPDNNFAIYPIENDKIITAGNYFGTGELTDWKIFKEDFINKFILK